MAVGILPNPNTGYFSISGTVSTSDHKVTVNHYVCRNRRFIRWQHACCQCTVHAALELDRAVARGIYLLNIGATLNSMCFIWL
jgi:hypothetical protein